MDSNHSFKIQPILRKLRPYIDLSKVDKNALKNVLRGHPKNLGGSTNAPPFIFSISRPFLEKIENAPRWEGDPFKGNDHVANFSFSKVFSSMEVEVEKVLGGKSEGMGWQPDGSPRQTKRRASDNRSPPCEEDEQFQDSHVSTSLRPVQQAIRLLLDTKRKRKTSLILVNKIVEQVTEFLEKSAWVFNIAKMPREEGEVDRGDFESEKNRAIKEHENYNIFLEAFCNLISHSYSWIDDLLKIKRKSMATMSICGAAMGVILTAIFSGMACLVLGVAVPATLIVGSSAGGALLGSVVGKKFARALKFFKGIGFVSKKLAESQNSLRAPGVGSNGLPEWKKQLKTLKEYEQRFNHIYHHFTENDGHNVTWQGRDLVSLLEELEELKSLSNNEKFINIEKRESMRETRRIEKEERKTRRREERKSRRNTLS